MVVSFKNDYCLNFSEQKRRLKEEKKAKEKAEKLAQVQQQASAADKKKPNDEDIDPNVCFKKSI